MKSRNLLVIVMFFLMVAVAVSFPAAAEAAFGRPTMPPVLTPTVVLVDLTTVPTLFNPTLTPTQTPTINPIGTYSTPVQVTMPVTATFTPTPGEECSGPCPTATP